MQTTDRYGNAPPDTKTACRGKCEGMGFVPIHKDEQDPKWKRLWMECEAKMPVMDGWHFVTCPECFGTGKRLGPMMKLLYRLKLVAPTGS